MADGFEIFDCPVRKNDSELDHVCSTLAQRLKSFISYPVAIVWMNPLQHSFEVGEAMPRIETPDSITFFRPVDRPCLAKDNGAGVAQPLCFGQIRFAAPERVFGALAFRDVARQAQKPTTALFPTRTSTGKEVPSLRLWRVSNVIASPASMRCFRRWMDVSSRPTSKSLLCLPISSCLL